MEPRLTSFGKAPTYVDVFAGCGGLSLGLHRAGWRGLFAVEKDAFAFETLSTNFLTSDAKYPFDWPVWLPKRPTTVEDLLRDHAQELAQLRGKVDMLAGGPPCQGFSSAGRRMADDPRNSLVERYLELVEILQPTILLLENVRGFTLDFQARTGGGGKRRENAAAQLMRRLSKNYEVETDILRASDFGVPQNRPRFILVAVRRGSGAASGALNDLRFTAALVAQQHGIGLVNSAGEAISDLELSRNETVPCPDTVGFEAVGYRGPLTPFQHAMRDGYDAPPSDTRLARHTHAVRERFADIIETCRAEGRGSRQLSAEMRERLGIRKLTTRVLDPNLPAPTVTSMPDDLLHYREPRTLTVRENARLQTFPDWFRFCGKYTTGGHLRRIEVPRFTQVANAVPPLLAEILGTRIKQHCLGAIRPKLEAG
ncbi:DNA cytosine methyltransferase [Sphingobium yanoikuyae]|uniref:DNA cytosine methyltransferase n=1 Tax=Sphingobium yanoikuyae TaxID=13690 RepID=UPI0019D05F78|nr:DNA cytosine methyltransferase [Sphingobium yanoikuyae]